MTKDEIQFWMLIAFAVAFVLSAYKIYIMFSAPAEGIDSKTQHQQLQDIIINFIISTKEVHQTELALFEDLSALEVLQDKAYKNFNLNRLYQILNILYITYKVDTLNELIKRIKNDT